MKKVLFFLAVLGTSFLSYSQGVSSLGSPTSTVNVKGGMLVDSMFVVPLRDTVFPASYNAVLRKAGAIVIKGTVPYYYTGSFWVGFQVGAAIDTTSLSNRINAKQDTTVSNTGHKILTQTTVQGQLNQADTALLAVRSTGIAYGGVGSVNGGVAIGNTVNYTAGSGQIFNNTISGAPTYNSVTWAAGTNVALVNTGVQYTYWYVDSTGTVTQTTTAPTRSNYRTRIWLFRTSYTNSVISGIAQIEVPTQQLAASMKDLTTFLGPIKGSAAGTNAPTYDGANMKLKITGGEVFDFGTNLFSGNLDPNVVTVPVFNTNTGNTFRYATTAGSINSDVTNLTFDNYQLAGVVTATPNNKFTIQYVLGFQGGLIRVLYGTTLYSSSTDAISAVNSADPYAGAPASITAQNSIVLGAIIAEKGTTTMNTQGTYIQTNKFGAFGGGTATSNPYLLTDMSNIATTTLPATVVTSSLTSVGTLGTLNVATSITGNYLTASEMLITNGSKNIVSAPVATYPSLTELTYLKGVTSAIQTQFTGKQSTITFGTGVQTALGVNIGSAGAPVLFNGAGGTPSSMTGTNITGIPQSGVTSLVSDLALKAPLASPTFTGTVTIPTPFTLGATSVTTTGTQLNYLNAATGTTGTTSTNLVFSTSPTLTTPTLGVASATSLNTGTTLNGTIFAKGTTALSNASTTHSFTFGNEASGVNGAMGLYSGGIGFQSRSNGASADMYLQPTGGITSVGDGSLTGQRLLSVVNTATGTADWSSVEIHNGALATASLHLYAMSTGFSASGMNKPNYAVVAAGSAMAGMSIGTKGSAPFEVWTNNTLRTTTAAASGNTDFTGYIKTNLGGIGYSTGAGAAVTQLTSRTTGISTNRLCGTITMFNAVQNANTAVTFTMTNTSIAATDILQVQHNSATDGGSWGFSTVCSAGSATITIRNLTAANITTATPLVFILWKGVTN